MSIHNAGATQHTPNVQQAQQAQRQLNELLADFKNNLANDLKDLTEELAGRVVVKQTKKDIDTLKESLAHVTDGKEIPAELAGEIAGIIQQQDDIQKKRKKRKDFEDKLEEFATLTEQIDLKKLSDKEKNVLEKFKKNIRTMKQLSRELKLLEKEEDELSEFIKKLQQKQKK